MAAEISAEKIRINGYNSTEKLLALFDKAREGILKLYDGVNGGDLSKFKENITSISRDVSNLENVLSTLYERIQSPDVMKALGWNQTDIENNLDIIEKFITNISMLPTQTDLKEDLTGTLSGIDTDFFKEFGASATEAAESIGYAREDLQSFIDLCNKTNFEFPSIKEPVTKTNYDKKLEKTNQSNASGYFDTEHLDSYVMAYDRAMSTLANWQSKINDYKKEALQLEDKLVIKTNINSGLLKKQASDLKTLLDGIDDSKLSKATIESLKIKADKATIQQDVRWYTTSNEVDSNGDTTLYSVPYANTGFKEDEPASTAFLYLTSGVANPSGAVIWASQISTVKAAPNSGILSFNVQTGADDTPVTSFTSGAALAAALASGSVHATKATGFKLRELILYTNSSYTTLDEIKKYRENAEIDLRFDADGHPVNAGTAGDLIIADSSAGEVIPVSSVTLNKTTLSLTKGGTDTLTASVLPAEATEKTVTWSVSPENVVTLSGTTGSSVTVTAAAAGECTITAAAGGKTVTCAVSVAENANPFPAIEAAYVLPNAKTFTPAAAEHIDTGVKLFDVLDPAPTFTILLEADASKTLTEATLGQTLLNCAEDTDSQPGLELRVLGGDKVQLHVYTAGPTLFATSELKAEKRRVVIRMKSGVFSAVRPPNGDVSNWGVVKGMDTPVTKSLILGARQKSDDTKSNFWDGTLYQCVVYKSALTDEQLKEWVHGAQEASTASVLGQGALGDMILGTGG